MHQQIAAAETSLRKRRKWRWRITLFCLLAAFAGYSFFALRGPEPIAVTSERAEIRNITQVVSATGKIRPEIEVKISPEVAGEIVEMPVTVGQDVKKGDLLVKIKTDNYVARVKQADASLSAAQADSFQRKAQTLNDQLDLRRARDLFGKHLISETEYKAAETKAEISQASYESALHQIDVARSNLDQNQDLLGKCVIYSPVDGTVSVLNSEVGERLVATGDFAGTEVMRVANLGSMEARVDVNENDVVNVEVGDKARIKVDAYPDAVFRGKVKRIASTATVKNEGTQQEVTNFEVRIQVVDSSLQLRPGMSTSVDIECRTVQQVVAVPVQSVTVRERNRGRTAEQLRLEREKQTGLSSTALEKETVKELQRVVFRKQGDKVVLVPVQTGIADDNFIEVKSGVQSGDEIVSGSYTALSKDLKDGCKVKIEPPKNER
ncbi:MAG: efflux RND transporter periplasmic adaptor subunit [Acidobacteria bacterium]|nr:MAG: efflux RND transporter periplasmic adaptor subunit [Acidobacteriota bacterium]